jgi:ATP-dependent exoDNAse (exonuclease V) beta subunit
MMVISAWIDDAEARLVYVAVTRTRHHLDLGGLSWSTTRRKSAHRRDQDGCHIDRIAGLLPCRKKV